MSTHSNLTFEPMGSPAESLRWPHWQRVTQRWSRRWGFAIAGLLLGFGGIGFIQSEASDANTLARQAVARLQLQLAALPTTSLANLPKPAVSDPQNLLASLPGAAQKGPVWAELPQVLSAHGLRLLALRPVAMAPVAPEKEIAGRLSSQAIEVRLQGRYEAWARAWAAITEAGPLCVIEQISVTATGPVAEVQINVVLRLWMRPGQAEGAWAALAVALPWADKSTTPLAGPLSGALFAQIQVAEPAPTVGTDAVDSANGADATLAGAKTVAVTEILSEDPRQWPVARVRLLGLWQQGLELQAILSAGPHWARVSPGQRVTLEGHRVASITDQGVSLQLAQGHLMQIPWSAKTAKVKK